jgi:hypothetical protein
LLFAAVNVFSRDPNFYIFLSFGQSKMEDFPGVKEQDRMTDNCFQVLAAADFPKMGRIKGSWYPAIPPLCQDSTGLSPTDYFGKTLASKLPANIKIGIIIIPIAFAGGTDIAALPAFMLFCIATIKGLLLHLARFRF